MSMLMNIWNWITRGRVHRSVVSEKNRRNHDLVIVSCVGSNVWDKPLFQGPVQAKDVYTNPYFTGNRKYAETFGKRWCVLSAKWGLMLPETLITQDYEATFSKSAQATARRQGKNMEPPISKEEVRQQVASGNPLKFEAGWEVVVLGSREDVDIPRYALADTGVKLLDPLRGLRIGEMMRAVRDAVEKGEPFN